MEEAALWFSAVIISLPKTVVATFLLWHLIGWQALIGVIFLCFLTPYYALMSSFSAVLRLRTAAQSDQRISLMTEVVSGIRSIKTHGWEDKYRVKTEIIRRREINIIRTKCAILASLAALEYTSVLVATLVSIIALVLSGQPLTPVNAFMLLAFLGMLRLAICFHLAFGFLEIRDAYVSLGRIQDFLSSENLSTIPSIPEAKRSENTSETALKDTSTQALLCASHLTYKGLNRKDEFILQDIELTTTSGSLTVVTGPVGSGKSTLLSAIAGEISDTSGITRPETIAYVPQVAWVFSGTLRENILFGQPYDEHRYTRIIKACALMEDIQQFPNGDETIVGERGVVLSGGQRARVSLARAVYVDADLYLLDDPLSAVDVKVGQQIFEKCIKDLLGNKTRLLTTHQEQHMKEAHQVIVLYKGRVLSKGKFTELQEKGILNQTLDPLYQKVANDDNSENNAVEENKGEGERMVPGIPSDAKGLEISVEDRTIGVVSSKLYWNYFRSGVPASVIIALVCFCLITQGKLLQSCSGIKVLRFLKLST